MNALSFPRVDAARADFAAARAMGGIDALARWASTYGAGLYAVERRPRLKTSMRAVAAWIAHNDGLTLEDMRSVAHKRKHARPRFMAYYVLGKIGWTSTQIGRLLLRHHSSVIEGAERWAAVNGLPEPTFSEPKRGGRRADRA